MTKREELMASLRSVKWGEFAIGDLFDILSGKDISNKEKVEGDVPYIASTGINNGISHYIDNDKDDGLIDRDVLSVARTGSVGVTFYHPYEAFFSNNVRRLKFLNLKANEHINLFVKTVIEHQSGKYKYGYIMGTNRLERQKILLPVTPSGEPDWNFMEQYMKRIENNLMKRVENVVA